MKLTGILLILFTVSIGVATFIENDFGTLAAKAKVYNARWFELVYLLLAVNLTGSIFKHKMYSKKKLTILLFHISFLIILLGSAVTRYMGYEGAMNIREGSSSNEFQSNETYISIWAEDDNMKVFTEQEVIPIPGKVSGFTTDLTLGSHNINFNIIDYFTNAIEIYVEEEGGEEIVNIVVSDNKSNGKSYYINRGQLIQFGDYTFAFETDFEGEGINILKKEGQLFLIASDSIEHTDMKSEQKTTLIPDSSHLLIPMDIYKSGNYSFGLKQYYESAVKKLTSSDQKNNTSHLDAFLAKISVDDQSKDIYVYGGKGYVTRNTEVELNGVKVEINFGSKLIKLPFSLKLDDFMLERYPGSNSPASYASNITLIDEANELVMPYRIYMNNVLNYRGYRFFQSSYDQDEMGTVLSVSHDSPGTIITYIGYLMMTIGMILSIFIKNSRFSTLMKLSSRLRQSRKQLITALLISVVATTLSFNANAQNDQDSEIPVIDKEHAEAFGKLLVQDKEGRIKPLNTVASEVLRKIYRKNTYYDMSPEQVFLGIMSFPEIWEKAPIIKLTHPQLKDFLSIEGKYAAFCQIIDLKSGTYKIIDFVERAYAKKPAQRNKFDKDIMQVDERANIFYMVFFRSILRVFPIPNDANNTWVSSDHAGDFINRKDSVFVATILSSYFNEVRKAAQSGDWTAADSHLESIKEFQQLYGKEILVTESKIKMELFYNRIDIFKRLSSYYGLIGFILLVFHFLAIFKPKLRFRLLIRISTIVVILLFALHTAGLILRWYIAGHAPWSDGYESLIFIAWATILAGLIFVRRSEITLSVTALLSSLILAVAGMSWMDPEITNLVPVLQSYWLIIHVAVITASYGFLALGALLGFFNLILMILKSKNNFERLNLTIKELSYIIEMTMIIGLFLLTIGTFLGGVWANESWGRYWGWDPKETWALATIVFYAFVVHMRLIPGLRGSFAFSFASLISYSFVIMTYFGVNYYLSGLHSYAAGDPVPVPNFVYYALIVIAAISILAYISDRRYNEIKQVDS